jgi:hypothetical protein
LYWAGGGLWWADFTAFRLAHDRITNLSTVTIARVLSNLAADPP